MPEGQRRLVWNSRLTAAVAAVGAAFLAAVYVTLAGQGNGGVAAECQPAEAAAAALDPLVGGELAAFTIARQPEKLSDLEFTCAPGRKEMPSLDRLQAALGGDDFEVVPISIDTGDPQRPGAFLQEIGVKNLPLNTDRTTRIFEELKAKGIAVGLPVTVLLDRKGCHLGHINGPAEWDSEDGKRLIERAIAAS